MGNTHCQYLKDSFIQFSKLIVALSGLCRKSQEMIGRDGILMYFPVR